jgi:hypothetical protein
MLTAVQLPVTRSFYKKFMLQMAVLEVVVKAFKTDRVE